VCVGWASDNDNISTHSREPTPTADAGSLFLFMLKKMPFLLHKAVDM
jgi:hypothetical protein